MLDRAGDQRKGAVMRACILSRAAQREIIRFPIRRW